jgi:3-oxoacyl-(acyl-carrier-protein) synthase
VIAISGLGSIGPRGPLSGPPSGATPAPSAITAWPAGPQARAYLVPPFRPAEIIPGVNTRRMDRLSIWCLAASALAMRDAGLDLAGRDCARVAVVAATGLGCLDLTEAFFRSARDHGWQQTDPILFPETLGNAPAGHIARAFGMSGPNITIGSRNAAGESALVTAASLLRHGQADVAIVLAGDTLTRPRYDWYASAGLLDELIPSEGVAAAVLQVEPASRVRGRVLEANWLRSENLAGGVTLAAPDPIADGLPGTGALFRLHAALRAATGPVLLQAGCAAVLLEAGA